MTNKLYKLMNWPKIEEIIYSESDNPHALLGPHKAGGQTLVQAYFPGAKEVFLQLDEEQAGEEKEAGGCDIAMETADEDGYFAVLLPERQLKAYQYLVIYGNGVSVTRKDPYRHSPVITKSDTEKFKNGIHYTIYEKLGAHPMEHEGERGTYFAVWAPNALRVSVVGDFNQWDGRVHQMRRLWDSGIFELFVPDAKAGDNYKFELKLKGGLTYLKADPYGNAAQKRPETASVIADLNGFVWEDDAFLKNRAKFQTGNVPVSVYEMYLGSFVDPREGEDYANYRDIAPKVIAYVKKMGYTHVELMPVMEHPFDGSWGYQVIGYYAPTARYGSPEDFMFFVNELHKAGIGVILDWVPAHFPRDTYGLSNFDGTCLYEHKDPRQGFHPHWGTLIYNYGRPQVSNYLIANALFWVEKYHADAIRMDAVASMLYLDYGKKDGEWVANMYGGKENLEAIEFMKHLNSIMKKRNPGVLSIAEESTAFPLITGSLEEGGLGFDLKWNMGFMNDYLTYIKYDPYFRSYHHGELTFSMIYAYSEKFMLVFSHDEVVHGKATMIGKMPGERKDKFANLRLTYSYMITHPGKKLLFMGQDIGEFDEWNENRRIEWELLQNPEHAGVAELMKDLNHLYRTRKALYELDDSPEGFAWINNISSKECYLSYLRKGADQEEVLLVVANFAGVEQEITTGVPFEGKYKEIFNSDHVKYGGSGVVNGRVKKAQDVEWDDKKQSITVKLAPLSLSILEFIPYTEEELERVIEQRIRKNTPVRKKKKGEK
ncbi:1,4-alpha-glucan branching protein GlgB [Candidatus Acetatifactor stercoripullorum]|uniref:1,4-alpha-glucan branching protein GlgB n=1 Tax=Candidatus Acetatifactor stercoripullorum TaxID=2838414 RepID=UPI00298E96FF|nr:1,4-alpha-glucan branching protein GlgB [Candidatus Acetatifactor stercoripullorum]